MSCSIHSTYSNFPNSFAVHIETVKETPAHGGGPTNFTNSVYRAMDLGDTKWMQLMSEIESIGIRRSDNIGVAQIISWEI